MSFCSWFLLEFLKQKVLQPYGLFHGGVDLSIDLCERDGSCTAWLLGHCTGRKNFLPHCLPAELGAWVDTQCGWREGAGAAVGSSPGLAGGIIRFQPGHGDDSLCAWPDGVSVKRSGKERRGAFLAAAGNKHLCSSTTPGCETRPCQRLGPPLSIPSQPSGSAFTAGKWRNKSNTKSRKEFGKLCDRVEVAVLTRSESCKDHPRPCHIPSLGRGYLTSSLQQG